jgi:hypothetical protein
MMPFIPVAVPRLFGVAVMLQHGDTSRGTTISLTEILFDCFVERVDLEAVFKAHLPIRWMNRIMRFEAITAVLMRTYVFWHVTPCRQLNW